MTIHVIWFYIFKLTV